MLSQIWGFISESQDEKKMNGFLWLNSDFTLMETSLSTCLLMSAVLKVLFIPAIQVQHSDSDVPFVLAGFRVGGVQCSLHTLYIHWKHYISQMQKKKVNLSVMLNHCTDSMIPSSLIYSLYFKSFTHPICFAFKTTIKLYNWC